MAEELRKDRSLPKYAQAITLYHMIVEGSLAQPGQHFIEDFLAEEGTTRPYQLRDGERLQGRAAAHRLRRQSAFRATGRGNSRLGGEPRRGGRAAAGNAPLRPRRLHAAELGPRIHRVLRLHPRGHLRFRAEADPPALARDRLPDRGVAAGVFPFDHDMSEDEIAGTRSSCWKPGSSASPASSSRTPHRSFSASSSTSSPAPRTRPRPTAPRSSTSGGSATRIPGTWSSTTARPGRSRAKRRTRPSRSRRPGATGSPRPGRAEAR